MLKVTETPVWCHFVRWKSGSRTDERKRNVSRSQNLRGCVSPQLRCCLGLLGSLPPFSLHPWPTFHPFPCPWLPWPTLATTCISTSTRCLGLGTKLLSNLWTWTTPPSTCRQKARCTRNQIIVKKKASEYVQGLLGMGWDDSLQPKNVIRKRWCRAKKKSKSTTFDKSGTFEEGKSAPQQVQKLNLTLLLWFCYLLTPRRNSARRGWSEKFYTCREKPE